MRFEIHPEALKEYNEASHYYARQQPGVDLRFINYVEQAVKSIAQNPTRWPRMMEMSGGV